VFDDEGLLAALLPALERGMPEGMVFEIDGLKLSFSW